MKPDTFTARVQAVVTRCQLPPVTATEDAINKRLVIQFQVEPPADVRALMRASGWQYRGGRMQAWVRPISTNARASQRLIMAQLTERTEADNL